VGPTFFIFFPFSSPSSRLPCVEGAGAAVALRVPHLAATARTVANWRWRATRAPPTRPGETGGRRRPVEAAAPWHRGGDGAPGGTAARRQASEVEGGVVDDEQVSTTGMMTARVRTEQ
jgi:hypothetical protein